jgi:hypothetical protein
VASTAPESPVTDALPPPPRARRRLSPFALDGWLLLVGALLHLIGYLSFQPLVLAFMYYALGRAVLLRPPLGGLYESRIFSRSFAACFLMAGVASVYASHWNDPSQLSSDAQTFFLLASGQAAGISIEELRVFFEGALAIRIWGEVYDLFDFLGFPRERYVGILFNVTVVAATGVLTIKMARRLFGEDPYRFQRAILLFATCGLFWLFAAIHIRDAVVLFVISALTYGWLYLLDRPTLGWRLVQVLALSLVGAFLLAFLRAEFAFVPIAMGVAGTAALLLGRPSAGSRVTAYLLLVVGTAALAGLLLTFGEEIRMAMLLGREGYVDLALDLNEGDSLGLRLLVHQPFPVRLILGSITLFLFPIPIWLGFQLQSVYHLFKSFNTVFFYFLIPLLLLAVRILWRQRSERRSSFVFLLLLVVGFTLAIAGTSLESRHLGAFLVPVLLLALMPELRTRAGWHNYRQLLMGVLGSVVVVHALWVLLKIM